MRQAELRVENALSSEAPVGAKHVPRKHVLPLEDLLELDLQRRRRRLRDLDHRQHFPGPPLRLAA